MKASKYLKTWVYVKGSRTFYLSKSSSTTDSIATAWNLLTPTEDTLSCPREQWLNESKTQRLRRVLLGLNEHDVSKTDSFEQESSESLAGWLACANAVQWCDQLSDRHCANSRQRRRNNVLSAFAVQDSIQCGRSRNSTNTSTTMGFDRSGCVVADARGSKLNPKAL